MNLESCLAQTSITDLRAIASYQKIEILPNTSHGALRTQLIHYFSNSDWVGHAVLGLTDVEHEILLQVHAEQGNISADLLKRIWGGDDVDAGSRWIWGQKVAPGIPSLRLTGLLYFIRYTTEQHNRYIIPDEIYSKIRMEPPAGAILTESRPPYQSKMFKTNILSDLFKLSRYFDARLVKPLKDGTLPKKYRFEIINLLKETNLDVEADHWESYTNFLFSAANNNRILELFENRLKPVQGFKTWVQKSPTQQLKEIFDHWRNTKNYDEFKEIPGLVVLTAGLRNPPRIVRKIILNALEQFPVNTWVTIESISKYLHATRPRFFRPASNDMHWLFKDPNVTGGQSHARWNLLESKVISYLMYGPLFWMGCLTLGIGKNRQAQSVKLTDFGMELLRDQTPTGLPIQEDDLSSIVIQPNFELLIPDNVVLSVRYKAEKIAQLESSGPVNRYKITQASIIRARESMSLDEIYTFLDEISAAEVPQNVIASIKSWSGQFGQIRLEQSFILKTSNPYLLEELMAQPTIQKFIDEIIGPCSATIHPSNVNLLLKQLRKSEYFPWVSPEIMLFQDLAPLSLQLTRSKADLLLRYLSKAIQRELIGFGEGHHSALDSIHKQLSQVIHRYDVGRRND